ncbi:MULTISPECIES: thiazole synthase [Paenibacillus]|uniref:Thiazole synthase n=1 Tax=Paenibacillus odorifer TaxID=189426 RepID=A0A1R0X2T2_9BACL|nr:MULTISPECIES: thiazole synthase [Paenibacillus]ETT64866.1 thiazole synthase [Paenibacillus sp. FSL H8-237]OMD16288.1 thiazole synthase [Paenibacillus odorifer]OMD27424.1 thiazole synthase [Paenibacillus odorifer]OME53834.1 thiazole synthase [Paenibacillus odorifer]OME60986.1 thiazole synthase [Paenibacillus odorifer]
MHDPLHIGGIELTSRLFIGTGKYSRNALIPEVIASSGSQVITVALRRVDPEGGAENIMNHIPGHMTLLPNTSGARTAEEAVRIARLARAAGLGNWVKIEVINDQKYLLPDNLETIRATEILAAEGFVVLPYMSPDLSAALRLRDAGAAAVMPLGAPIGTNRGLRTKELVRILIEEVNLPIIVDAGIGKPSEAAEAMEMGAAAVLLNTAIATARNPLVMAEAFREAISAGRKAYLAGLGPVEEVAFASSPLTGFLN